MCCNISQSWLFWKFPFTSPSFDQRKLIWDFNRNIWKGLTALNAFWMMDNTSSCLVSKETVRSIRYCQARQVEWLGENPQCSTHFDWKNNKFDMFSDSKTIPPSLHPHQRAVLPRFANWCCEGLTPHKLPNLGLDSAAQDASPILNINTSLESNPSKPLCSSWDEKM